MNQQHESTVNAKSGNVVERKFCNIKGRHTLNRELWVYLLCDIWIRLPEKLQMELKWIERSFFGMNFSAILMWIIFYGFKAFKVLKNFLSVPTEEKSLFIENLVQIFKILEENSSKLVPVIEKS